MDILKLDLFPALTIPLRPWLGGRGLAMVVVFLGLFAAVALVPGVASAAPGPALCEKKAAGAVALCAKKVGFALRACYRATGDTCQPGDTRVAAARTKLTTLLKKGCGEDDAIVEAAGYGGGGLGGTGALTYDALGARLWEECGRQAQQLATASFGGPHAPVAAAASKTEAKCLDQAFKQGNVLLNKVSRQHTKCILKERAGKTCNRSKMTPWIAAQTFKAIGKVSGVCAGELENLVGVSPAVFFDRVLDRGECLVAAAHPGTADELGLETCGPREMAPWVDITQAGVSRLVLPYEAGAIGCADSGSDYRFFVRPAAGGPPYDKVMIYLQGGGYCVDADSCEAKRASQSWLFNSNASMPQNGIFDTGASNPNPFADWTHVYIPYCTQDLHLGTGASTPIGTAGDRMNRNGANNLRRALGVLRDQLWFSADQLGGDGYRPDNLQVLFAGGSAGGGGVVGNYHFLLDELGWVQTMAVPTGALGLDPGQTMGALIDHVGVFTTDPANEGWGARAALPSYCHTGDCVACFSGSCEIGLQNLERATAARWSGANATLAHAKPRFLNISNQLDQIQAGAVTCSDDPAAYWPAIQAQATASVDVAADTRTNSDYERIHYFLPFPVDGTTSRPLSEIHVFLQEDLATGIELEVAGANMLAWLDDAVSNPAGVVDQIATPWAQNSLNFTCP